MTGKRHRIDATAVAKRLEQRGAVGAEEPHLAVAATSLSI